MSLAIEAFVDNVRRYCQWVESDHHDLPAARQLLLALMQGIPHLVVERESDADFGAYASRKRDGVKSDFKRLEDFPFHHYRMVYSPCEIDKEEPVVNDVRDDLADIYWDLWHGLEALNRGDTAYAVQYWRDFYFYHWGHHASSAIYAIDVFYQKMQNGEPDAARNRQ